MTSYWCLYCYLGTYLTPCFNVSIANLKQVNTNWAVGKYLFNNKDSRLTSIEVVIVFVFVTLKRCLPNEYNHSSFSSKK